MKISFESRKWHIWVSLILALPILIVAVTAIFIAHDKSLKLEEVPVSVGWLPGYAMQAGKPGNHEPRALLLTRSGEQWVGLRHGLYRVEGETLRAVPALAGTQVRGLAEASWGRVVAAKNGVWVERDGTWTRAIDADAWNVSLRPDGGVTVALKDEGLQVSHDGVTWTADVAVGRALAALPASAQDETMNMHKLVMDLHTGKAFLGKRAEWIWIDLIGVAMALLALTGVYMWWRGEKRKSVLQAGAAAAPRAGTTHAL